ncbi:MAG: lipocalin-like domain-containing protein [Prevotella sp.]|nr:lipocalin-like domain-containing protein [Prevotella sp.]
MKKNRSERLSHFLNISFSQYLIFSISLFLIFTFTSCELETSGNGDLDGFWHLVQVDTLQTGGIKDTSKDLIFWSFQVNLLELSDHTNLNDIYMARFNHDDGQLKVTQPCLYNRDNGNEMLTEENVNAISQYGINALEETFRVEGLSGSRMTLSNGTLRLNFKKM